MKLLLPSFYDLLNQTASYKMKSYFRSLIELSFLFSAYKGSTPFHRLLTHLYLLSDSLLQFSLCRKHLKAKQATKSSFFTVPVLNFGSSARSNVE